MAPCASPSQPLRLGGRHIYPSNLHVHYRYTPFGQRDQVGDGAGWWHQISEWDVHGQPNAIRGAGSPRACRSVGLRRAPLPRRRFWSHAGIGWATGRLQSLLDTHGPPKPHAVTQVARFGGGSDSYAYDQNGNLTGGNTLSAVYDHDNLPWSVTRVGAGRDLFVYAPGNRRVRHRDVLGGTQATTYYGNAGYERIYRPSGALEHRHHLPGTLVTIDAGGQRRTTYVHSDRLGSTTALSNTDGQIFERRSFDAFGKTRHGNFADRAQGTLDLDPPQNRGFTEHEHLDRTRLIHMNGRSYDW